MIKENKIDEIIEGLKRMKKNGAIIDSYHIDFEIRDLFPFEPGYKGWLKNKTHTGRFTLTIDGFR